jgi:polar amino acid transport system substrate-binding protein
VICGKAHVAAYSLSPSCIEGENAIFGNSSRATREAETTFCDSDFMAVLVPNVKDRAISHPCKRRNLVRYLPLLCSFVSSHVAAFAGDAHPTLLGHVDRYAQSTKVPTAIPSSSREHPVLQQLVPKGAQHAAMSPSLAFTLPVRVVMEISPPHQMWLNDQPAGITTSLVQRILQLADLPAQFEVYPWARGFKLAKHTPNMLIFNMARTKDREDDFIWIGEVNCYQLSFFTLATRTDIALNSIEDAKAYSIAAARDDFSSQWLQQQGFTKQLHESIDIEQSWHLLRNGKVDLVIDDPFAATYMARRMHLQPEDIRQVMPLPALSQKTWLALHKSSDPALVARLQQAFARVTQETIYQSALQLPGAPAAELPGGVGEPQLQPIQIMPIGI